MHSFEFLVGMRVTFQATAKNEYSPATTSITTGKDCLTWGVHAHHETCRQKACIIFGPSCFWGIRLGCNVTPQLCLLFLQAVFHSQLQVVLCAKVQEYTATTLVLVLHPYSVLQ